MRYLLTLLLIIFSCALFAQVPQGTPNVNNFLYNRFNGYVRIDSGLLFQRDTSWKPVIPAFTIWQHSGTDTAVWYYNGRKWQRIATPFGDFVRYSDSLKIFITPTQLGDSLGNYVTLHTTQTVDGSKTFDSDLVINDTATINADIIQANPSHTQSVFKYDDSLKYVDADGAYIFKNRISGLTKTKGLNPLVISRQRLYLNKAQDTMLLSGVSAADLNVMNAFLKKNNSDDTVKVTAVTAGNPFLKTISSGLEVTTDTSLISDRTTYWRIRLPVALNYSYVGVTNHGYLDTVVDYDIGNTYYLNGGSSDSAFKIGRHEGIRIENLSSNAINQTSAAINQLGGMDTVYLHSQNIQFDNLKTNLTPAYRVLQDASGNVFHKAYLQGSATLDFPSTSAQTSADLTITVTGATNGDPVYLGVPNAAVLDNTSYTAWVSAADTVTVRLNNYSASSKDPASATFKVIVTPL